jgi:hemolysin III
VNLLRDPVSSASHFLTAFACIGIGLFLLRLTRGDSARQLCMLVFGCSTTGLYLASGLYHALRLPVEELRFFQLLDMSAIYVMIAGSATPVFVFVTRGRLRMFLLLSQWSIALFGILSLWVLQPGHEVIIATYLGMGWVGCACIATLWRATGWIGMRWFVAATAFYVAGAVFELMNWPTVWTGVIRAHELLHFCDVLGTACYVVYLVKYVIPYVPPVPEILPEPVVAIPAHG